MTHPFSQLALRAVADACRVARSVQRHLEQVRQITKDDRSPVTVADFAVQAMVAMDLCEREAQARIVGEEKAALLRMPGQAAVLDAVVEAVRRVRPAADPEQILHAIDRCDHDASADAYWVLDPIDGTKGFLRGQQYAIALARIENGSVVLGVMGCPNLPIDRNGPLEAADVMGSIYAAALDDGAWEISGDDPAAPPTRTRAAERAADDPLRVCESVEPEHSEHADAERVIDLLGRGKAPIRVDSQCKYALVARGQADAYLRLPTKRAYVEKIWDHAAGSLIATEAGAVVSDISGSPLEFTHGRRLEANRGIICATAELHGRVIDAVARLGIGS